MSRSWTTALAIGMIPVGAATVRADDETAEDLIRQARTALANGRETEALTLADRAVQAEPESANSHLFRAMLHANARRHDLAITDLDVVIQLEPTAPNMYNLRGAEHFKLGHIGAAIVDFDKYLELRPDEEPHHWQRGIAYYYAGRFKDGARQFDVHKTVNPNDVENAVWRYLCMTPTVGVKKARDELLSTKGDSRVPMKEIHALYAGKGSVADVMAATQADKPIPRALNQRLFYANLYIGLYYESLGDAKRAREHITRAVQSHKIGHYMWDVGKVHLAFAPKIDFKSAPAKD
jgi:lipoprotein NlpI